MAQVVGLLPDFARREEDEVGGRGRVRHDQCHEHVGEGLVDLRASEAGLRDDRRDRADAEPAERSDAAREAVPARDPRAAGSAGSSAPTGGTRSSSRERRTLRQNGVCTSVLLPIRRRLREARGGRPGTERRLGTVAVAARHLALPLCARSTRANMAYTMASVRLNTGLRNVNASVRTRTSQRNVESKRMLLRPRLWRGGRTVVPPAGAPDGVLDVSSGAVVELRFVVLIGGGDGVGYVVGSNGDDHQQHETDRAQHRQY